MGKFGYIGNKIVVILVSIGILVFFVYFGEVSYGDLGMIIWDDVVMCILNLGEISEVLSIIFVIKWIGVKMILLIGNFDLIMVKFFNVYVCIKVS